MKQTNKIYQYPCQQTLYFVSELDRFAVYGYSSEKYFLVCSIGSNTIISNFSQKKIANYFCRKHLHTDNLQRESKLIKYIIHAERRSVYRHS